MLLFLLFLCAIAAGIHALALPAVDATSEDSKCTDLAFCRSIWNIIWSSLATIFACAWVSVHRNIPDPDSRGVAVTLERIRITIWALLVPEYIIAWAIRQWIVAREISKEFNKLAPMPPHVTVRPDSGYSSGPAMRGIEMTALRENGQVAGPVAGPADGPMDVSVDGQAAGQVDGQVPPWRRYMSAAVALCSTLGSTVAKLWELPIRAFHNKDPWTVTHGFFVLMGGFLYFDGDKRQYPVSREDLKVIFTTRPLEVPNEAEINDKSKGDAFSKTVTVAQTLWFVAQCIARAIQGLTVTKLEIVTLAYTAISMAMYYFWWSKPLSVSRPIRVKRIPGPELSHHSETSSQLTPGNSAWGAQIKNIVKAVVGTQDDDVHLSELHQVPTFYAGKPEEHQRDRPESNHSASSESLPKLGWGVDIKKFVHAVVGTQDDEVKLWMLDQAPTFYAGKPEEHQVLFADAIALAFAIVFGAIHCIAWSFAFPSHAEKLLWRISAIALVGVPAIYIVFVVLIAMDVKSLAKPTLILSTVGIPFYLLARVVLLVLAFTTLRGLSPDAYETIHWTTFIPHV
ncbi:hypothetical protein FIBSPDRAFT_841118 [Athelia psychrophila]|uniref:Uncharacterized protein n=1 Tax=Athelia psychrophila TaxID=1759441 RepID=A0A165WGE3_9AGAM|nr:hypothetical protein FIBSPDRAFT_841118 [Fibularhizoctonia sp. CBS 109695]